MAAQRTPNGVANKRRSKKRQKRTEVSSSSESSDSESDVSSKTSKKSASEEVVEKPASPSPVPEPSAKKSEKKSKSTDDNTPMTDAPQESSVPVSKKSKTPVAPQEDFSAIYLRKIAAELADDLDKVREAQDFKANSVPMLIHALKQGESMYSAEEKRRVMGAASN